MKRIVVFAPHPDDETLGCGGTIAKRITEGCEVNIVVMTDGRYAFVRVLGIESDPTPDELRLIRKKECIEAMKILGVTNNNLEFLEFEDESLTKRKKDVEKRITDILRCAPDEIYLPYGRDYNIDHQVTNRIVHSSIRKLGLTTLAYEYSIAPKYALILLLLRQLISSNTLRNDISDFLSVKETAIKQYRSQISMINDKQKKPVLPYVQRFLKKEETLFLKRYF